MNPERRHVMMLSPLAVFGFLLLLYLLPVVVGYVARVAGRAQLFIVVCLIVSGIAMFPPTLVLLSTKMTVFSVAAAGVSLIFPSLLWFCAFAAACLAPPRTLLLKTPTKRIEPTSPLHPSAWNG
jgi:hypothetical protein